MFRLGRIFGIPVGIDPTWLPMAALITWTLSQSYFPAFLPRQSATADIALALLAMALLFACLLAHEFAHALTARAYGLPTARIMLFMFGGVAMMRGEPPSAKAEFWIAVAGPAMSFLLALGALGLSLALALADAPRALRVLVDYLFAINLVFALFNLIPAFPMDGGRVLRALLWRRSRRFGWSTLWATRVSQALAALAIGWGVWRVADAGLRLDTVWPILIGAFIFVSARRVYLSVRG